MLRTTVFLLTILSIAVAQAAQVLAPDSLQGDGRVSAFYTWEAAIPKPGQLLRREELDRHSGSRMPVRNFAFFLARRMVSTGNPPRSCRGYCLSPKASHLRVVGRLWLGHMRRPGWLTSARHLGSATRQGLRHS
jgi:hypothetical protein